MTYIKSIDPDEDAYLMRQAEAEAIAAQEADMCPNCVTPWKCNGPHETSPIRAFDCEHPGPTDKPCAVCGIGPEEWPDRTDEQRRPSTPTGQALMDAPDVLLMMSGDEIIGLNEGELEQQVLSIEAEAGAKRDRLEAALRGLLPLIGAGEPGSAQEKAIHHAWDVIEGRAALGDG